jgi:hypothetical protein
MCLIFLGPPAASKGTQAPLLSRQLNIPPICTGDILRQEIVQTSPLGLQSPKYVEPLIKRMPARDRRENPFLLFRRLEADLEETAPLN